MLSFCSILRSVQGYNCRARNTSLQATVWGKNFFLYVVIKRLQIIFSRDCTRAPVAFSSWRLSKAESGRVARPQSTDFVYIIFYTNSKRNICYNCILLWWWGTHDCAYTQNLSCLLQPSILLMHRHKWWMLGQSEILVVYIWAVHGG